MLDQDTARLLVSEALKNRLLVEETDETKKVEQNEIITAEFIFSSDNEKFSFRGPVIDIEAVSHISSFIQFKSSIQDVYELFSLLKDQTFFCLSYSLNYLEKSVELVGPFKTTMKKMTNFDYVKNQCVVCVELIKIKQ